ncbi:MAG TPA: hypothetical protein VLM79_10805 [Kofleriaceae bacterium]|nr:hypothetical protein [Kofleriaceae bacterium]
MCRVIPALFLLSVACGSRDNSASPPLDVGMSSVAVMKARRAHDDHLLLLQTLTPIADVERPRRLLRRFRPDGERLDYVTPEGASLADFTLHPGGEASILLESDAGYALERWLPDGTRSGSVELTDLAPTAWSRDSGRTAAVGDDVVLAVRAADNSVRAYRYTPDAAGYRRIWETVVEPANDLFPAGLISGSFDTFGQLRNPFRVYVDVGSDDAVWVGVPVDPATDLLLEHNAEFGDDLRFIPGAIASSDALLTRLDGAGRRVFSRMVGTQWADQIYAMRAVVGGVLVAGRSETTQGDAGGWDGLLAQVAGDGAVSARTIDISAGDVFFDADVLSDGRTVAVGGTGYTDNPSGGSISEECSLLAVVLTDDAQTVLSLPHLPRHNELRTLLVDTTTVWVAGMSDGPGTHSGDGDPSAIRAEPFVANVAVP